MLNRRSFLNQSSLLSLSPFIPGFLSQTAHASKASKDDRILVVIQLDGGNDGLNTVIPFADEIYAKYRDKLRIDKKEIIKLNDSLGLHPGMKDVGKLFDNNQLAIVPGVGYPNPNRSHFRSMAIWHSARLDPTDHTGQGWIGRACDQQQKSGNATPDAVFVGDSTIPAAIIGRRTNSIALNKEEEFMLVSNLAAPDKPVSGDDLQSFVQSTVNSSYTAAKQFAESTKNRSFDKGGYPNYRLARKLHLISRIIRLNSGTRIFYVSQPGYDTHSMQKNTHARLLAEFSRSLKAFLVDIKKAGFSDRIMVMAFSEFGRRVKENASVGTDHGTSGPVFIAGEMVNAGVLSKYPSLEDLQDGDLKSTIDFRSIYTSLLTDWLNIDATVPLGGAFKSLRVVS
ncbi:DUF1501 domain-containing protein [Gimesia aquarii]|uniref:DUF1501 domain-containing protein n=1 Tax=Gimesia aquarii TaxID=2527964 RepID=A0A517W3Z5_9PLAN|nr:DUF1501 domain-containing protein [Gimesia aquarii]QDT99974.1 hypothetical protein V144x_54880 [Gimesia aquarii]